MRFVWIAYGVCGVIIALAVAMTALNFLESARTVAATAEVLSFETRTERRMQKVRFRVELGGGETVWRERNDPYTATLYLAEIRVPLAGGGAHVATLDMDDDPVAVGDQVAVRYYPDALDDVVRDKGDVGLWAGPLLFGVVFGGLPLGVLILIGRKFNAPAPRAAPVSSGAQITSRAEMRARRRNLQK